MYSRSRIRDFAALALGIALAGCKPAPTPSVAEAPPDHPSTQGTAVSGLFPGGGSPPAPDPEGAKYDGNAQAIDNVLINKPAREHAAKFGFARLDADFPLVYSNDANRPERLSDHDAAIFYFSLDAVQNQKAQ